MTEDVKPEVIKRTQELLSKYFKKPPLTEKLLKKPPFRFLHDIISAIIEETGFLEGLFSEQELNSDNIKDKEAKLAYLTKLIDVVKLINGGNLTVRASKIIAGHEPTKTNELLQAIGRSLDKKVSSAEAIERYKKNGDKKTRTTGRSKLPSKEEPVKKPASRQSSQTRRSTEKEKPVTEQKKRSNSTGKASVKGSKVHNEEKRDKKHAQEKDILAKKDEQVIDIPPAEPIEKRQSSSVKRKDVTSPKISESPQIKPAQLDSADSPMHKRKESMSQNRKESASNRGKQSSNNQQNESSAQRDKEIEITVPRELKTATSIEKDVLEKNSDFSESSKRDKEISKRSTESAKLSSTRKPMKIEKVPSAVTKQPTFENPGSPPPQLLGNISDTADTTASTDEPIAIVKASLRPPSARPVSARPAAPRMRSKTEFIVNENISTPMGNVNVIIENFDSKEDDADDMVVIKTDGSDSLGIDGSNRMESQLTQEHGHLVAQILETQRELVNTDNIDVMPKKVEIEWEAGLKRERETTIKEVDKLRGAIQTLTRATNPLGKLLDYLQEDVEIMQKELQEWRSQYNELSEQLEKEQIQTQELIEPMKETLKDIENNMNVQLDEIFQIKSNIMKNDSKIQRLLNGQL